jgi:hypothetical protein
MRLKCCIAIELCSKFDVWIDALAPFQTTAETVGTIRIAQNRRCMKQFSRNRQINRNSTPSFTEPAEGKGSIGREFAILNDSRKFGAVLIPLSVIHPTTA